MEQNLMQSVDGIYTPQDTVAPFMQDPVLPEFNIPSVDPGVGASDKDLNFENEMNRIIGSAASVDDKYRAFNPIPFNTKETGFDPIYKSFKDSLYPKLGFLPGVDNEDIYANELGKSGQFMQGLKGILPLAAIAHNEAWSSEADFWGGLFSGNFKKAFGLTMDQNDLMDLHQRSSEIFESNFVPLTREQRDSSFNMGKFSRGMQQFGFTAGTIAQYAEQSLAEMALTALTAPETLGGSIVAEIANMARRTTKAIRTLDKLNDVSNAYKKIMKFENTFMSGEKARKVYDYIKTQAKNSPVGSFSNFYKFSKEYNFAAAEARFERAQSYGDYIENKEREHYERTGRPMSQEDLARVEEEALKVSNANGVTNIALLFAMNRINMGNVLKMGFGLSKRMATEASRGIADDIVRTSTGGNMFQKAYNKLRGKAGKEAAEPAVKDAFVAAHNVKRFSNEWWRGKGNSLYQWGTDSAFEGVQEIGQGLSSSYWQNYYNDKFNMAEETRDNWDKLLATARTSLGKAVGEQMSTEGLDTFLSGFIIGGPSAMINMGIGKAQKMMYADKFAKRNAYIDEQVKFLNDWARSPFQLLNPQLKNYADQNEIAQGMTEAVKQDNIYAFKNLERKAFQKFVMNGYNTGKLDAMLDIMDNAADTMSDEDFFNAFGIKADSLSKKTAKEYVQAVRNKSEAIVKNIDKAKRTMTNPFNPRQYNIGSPERKEEELKSMAWDYVLEQHVFERDAHEDTMTRYKDILGKVQENLGGVAYNTFYKLTNPEFIKEEMNLLSAEITMLETMGTLTPQQRVIRKARIEQRDQLKKLSESLEVGNVADERLFNYFNKYINAGQRSANAPELTFEQMEASFKDLSDLFRLDSDSRQAISNLNFLADPDNFDRLFNMHYSLLSDKYREKQAALDKMMDERIRIAELLETDEDFKRKYSELHQMYAEARFEGNNDFAGVVLDSIAEKEEEANKPVEETTPSEEAPGEQTNTTTTGQPPVAMTLQEKIDKVKSSSNLTELMDMMSGLDENSPEDIALLDVIVARLEQIEKEMEQQQKKKTGQQPGSQTVSMSDPKFADPYNKALEEIQRVVAKDNVSADEVKAAFKAINPLMNMLSQEDRMTIFKKHKAEMDAILEAIAKRDDSTNVQGKTSQIDAIFAKKQSLQESYQEVYDLINLTADPAIKEQLISEFERVYAKAVDKHLAKLSKLTNNSGMSVVRAELLKSVTDFKNRLNKSLESYKKQAIELSEKTKDIDLEVEYDINWTNPVHRAIEEMFNKRRRYPMTGGQAIAIENLISAGLLNESDNSDSKDMLEASTTINRGVARIYALQINKALHRFAKTKQLGDLEKILTSYFKDAGLVRGEELKTFIKETIQDITDIGDDVDLILQSIGVPKTEILNDDQYKLIDKYRYTIINIQTESGLLSVLDTLNEKQLELIEKGDATEIGDILTTPILQLAGKVLKKDTIMDDFEADMIAAAEELRLAESKEEAKKIIDALVETHGKDYNKADARNIFSAILSFALETENAVNNPMGEVASLSEEEMEGILLTGQAVSLSSQDQMALKEFASTKLLTRLVDGLRKAPGVINNPIVYNPEFIEIQSEAYNPRFSALRQKSADDTRTKEDLAKRLEINNGVGNAHTALQMIIDSDFSTAAEIELAQRLLDIIPADYTFKVDNTIPMSGGYMVETDEMLINLEAAGYSEDLPSVPVETLILHELLHKLTASELEDTNSEYRRNMLALYNAVAKNLDAKTFYAFNGLTEEEGLAEFIVEAFTNPAFQYLLAKTPYGSGRRSLWDKFVQLISDLLTKLGIDVDNSVLNQVIAQTIDIIEPARPGDNSEAGELKSVRLDIYGKVVKAKTPEDLAKIRKEVVDMLKRGVLSEQFYNEMISSINAKYKTIKAAELAPKYRKGKPISVDGKAYRYMFDETGLQVFKMSRNGVKKITSAAIKQAIVEQLAKKAGGKYSKLLLPDAKRIIRDLGGDIMDPSSYAAGGISSDITAGFARFKELYDNEDLGDPRPFPFSLKFRSQADFANFKKDYMKARRVYAKQGATAFAQELKNLETKYGATAVKNFSEMYSRFGNMKDINNLIKSKVISVGPDGMAIEESPNPDLAFEMFDFVLKGGNLDISEAEDISNQIGDVIQEQFGFRVSPAIQKQIEQELFMPQMDDDQDGPPPPPPPPGPDETNGDPVVIYSVVDPTVQEDIPATDFTLVTRDQSKAPTDSNPMRSTSFDVDKNGDQTSSFKNYYFKIRNIINKLALQDPEAHIDFHVTIDNDNAELRWDGSATDPQWISAVANSGPGQIAYISDKDGNPLIFNTSGDVVGTLDRGNLADHKSLNNGENQIIYFNIPKTNKNNVYDQAALDVMIDVRNKVANNQPYIAKVSEIRKGQLNNKILVTPSDASKNRQDTRNPDFFSQLMQPHVEFVFSNTGTLLVKVNAPDGGYNAYGLFAPNTRNIRIKTPAGEVEMFDHLMSVMEAYNQMEANGDPAFDGDLQNNLLTFVRNFWFTSNTLLKIPANMKKMIIQGKDGIMIHKNLFTVKDGVVSLGDPADIQAAKNFLNNRPINVYTDWFSGKIPFRFPYVVEENGRKVVKFVEKDYKDFLFKEIGFKSNLLEVKSADNLQRYNSTIHFTTPQPLAVPVQVAPTNQEELTDNANAAKDKIEEAVKNAEPAVNPKPVKKGRWNKAPRFDKIYEKTCN